MNGKVLVVTICLLSLIVVSVGCDTGKPSDADIEQTIFRQIARYAELGITSLNWVQEVEVIALGRPSTIRTIFGDYTYWPVKVYLIGGGRIEQQRVDFYKDEFGEWKVAGLV